MTLMNLNNLALIARQECEEYDKSEIKLPVDFQTEFSRISSDIIEFGDYTVKVIKNNGLIIIFPNQWFFLASCLVEYSKALQKYKDHCSVIFLRNPKYSEIIKNSKENKVIPENIVDTIDSYFPDAEDQLNFKKFLTDYDWWFGSKTIDRNDFKVSAILSLAKVVHASQSYISDLTDVLSQNPNLTILLKAKIAEHKKNRNEDSENIDFKLSFFCKSIKYANYKVDDNFIKRFVASLITKPFVILTGLSGSGKTKLAQAFVTWISASPSQFCILPVGADWTNREPLLGYPNGLEEKKFSAPDSGSLQLLIRAMENPTLPHFLILDEMNLSHVERYFADFLSVMESHDKIRLYSGGQRTIPSIEENEQDIDVPQEIGWPKNLFIIGTVNIDETTYMFSPKVLDRANVIEFRISADEMDKFLQEPIKPDLSNLLEEKENPDKGGLGKGMAADFMDLAIEKKIPAPTDEKLVTTLNGFFTELQKAGAEFGYRSASEILLLIKNLEKIRVKNESVDDLEKIRDEHLDIAIMQKLLPKLHGSRNKLIKVLETLAGLCLAKDEDPKTVKSKFLEPFSKNEKTEIDFEGDKIRFKISFLKLCRMYKAAMENGYASYAEA